MKLLCLATALGAMQFSNSVIAGEYEIGVAKGLMIASITHEKCTGTIYGREEVEKQFRMLKAKGFAVKEVEQGFDEGNYAASSKYLYRKPSKSECQKAADVYTDSLKFTAR